MGIYLERYLSLRNHIALLEQEAKEIQSLALAEGLEKLSKQDGNSTVFESDSQIISLRFVPKKPKPTKILT